MHIFCSFSGGASTFVDRTVFPPVSLLSDIFYSKHGLLVSLEITLSGIIRSAIILRYTIYSYIFYEIVTGITWFFDVQVTVNRDKFL